MKKHGFKRSTVATITILSIITLLLVSLTVAFLTDSRSTLNILGIGTDDENGNKAVQIALLQEAFGQLDNAEVTPTENGFAGEFDKVVVFDLLPGDKVNNDSTVKNVGRHDVYVRVRLTDEDGELLDTTAAPYDKLIFEVDTTNWTYDDVTDYYYYTGATGNNSLALANDQSVAVFKDYGNYTMEISTTINNQDLEVLGQLIDIKIDVEAIQAENFEPTPINGTDDPWNGEVILAATNPWNGNNE